MKVEANRAVGTQGIRKDGKGKGSSSFADSLSPVDSDTAPSGVSSAPALSGVEALFALQEVPDATDDRTRAAAKGDKLLDRLDDLRTGLLLGHISRDKLAELARLARDSSENVADPQLREVLQEIELRAQVELAKLQTSET
jgi:hypothetical protein